MGYDKISWGTGEQEDPDSAIREIFDPPKQWRISIHSFETSSHFRYGNVAWLVLTKISETFYENCWHSTKTAISSHPNVTVDNVALSSHTVTLCPPLSVCIQFSWQSTTCCVLEKVWVYSAKILSWWKDEMTDTPGQSSAIQLRLTRHLHGYISSIRYESCRLTHHTVRHSRMCTSDITHRSSEHYCSSRPPRQSSSFQNVIANQAKG